MSELDKVKQEKMEKLKNQLKKQQAERKAQAQLDSLLKQVLSEKAKARLGNVKLVNQELYLKAAQTILYLYRAGQIQGKLNEKQLKELLKKLSSKREPTIKRK
jgi:programmed cell death protein 5